MSQDYTSLGLMSGTSGDGVDASIIESDGNSQYKTIEDKFFQYDNEISKAFVIPAIRGALSVPGRYPLSCPPPKIQGDNFSEFYNKTIKV